MKYICLSIYFQYSQKNPYVGQYARTAVQIPLCCCFRLVALQVSYSPGWHPTSFLAETGLELLILLVSQVLRLQACITTPNLQTVLTLHWFIRNNNSNKNSTCSKFAIFPLFSVCKVQRYGIYGSARLGMQSLKKLDSGAITGPVLEFLPHLW